ncbi:MAG TPA: glycine cleavage system aminomethyltransferase GcvT, partial [Anaerolineales bacterium]|nr:glycine cleavage system aminomethyltransferase GcvT [Anaerolineales bacterium]
GIVVNRNTIPGDKSAANPSGLRMGTSWVTQRGFGKEETIALADVIADTLHATTPYGVTGRSRQLQRAKVDFDALEDARLRVRTLAETAGVDFDPPEHGYPHFYYLDDYASVGAKPVAFDLRGERVRSYLNFVVSSDVEALRPGSSQATHLSVPHGEVDGTLTCLDPYRFRLTVPGEKAGVVAAWLRDLSDGYVSFDEDLDRKVPGPIWVKESQEPGPLEAGRDPIWARKPYFVGLPAEALITESPPIFQWHEMEGELRRTPVFEVHKNLGAKLIPFAGWEMPVWYTSVVEEHLAVRQAAGLFDVAHMGVYQAEGPDAAQFLDSVVGNDIAGLGVGESLYTHFLDPDANVIDDLLVYRRAVEKFLVVVNASNDDKDRTWLHAVKDGEVLVDRDRPWARAFGRNVTLRNLRDPKEGPDMRVDIALQGPRSRDILLALGCDESERKRIMGLKRTQLCDAVVGGLDLVVSRTGYTGERMAFELFVHPDRAASLFEALLQAGEPFGLRPCGLGARDSLRTEAGLPLYGHEMGGELNLGVAEAGFAAYVKTYKPWFVGRKAFMEREVARQGEVVRFRFNEKGVRMAHLGDPVVDRRGRVVGSVTSCAIDKDGYLTGQAFVDFKNAEEGTPVLIYQGAPRTASKAPADLQTGDRVNLPTAATVVSRFPK